MTLDEVIQEVAKRNGDLDKDIYHYLMMYRYLLRKQGESEERKRREIAVARRNCIRAVSLEEKARGE